MSSYFDRYMLGEHVTVWNELHAITNIEKLESHVLDDAKRVVLETIRRIRSNLVLLVKSLKRRGYKFESDTWSVPSTAETVGLAATLASDVGPVPWTLAAWLDSIGNISFRGQFTSDPAAEVFNDKFLDPFEFGLSAGSVAEDLDRWREDEPPDPHVAIDFAGDTWHKNDTSGGAATYVVLPMRTYDAQVVESSEQRPEGTDRTWLVDYLRRYFAGGGFCTTSISLLRTVPTEIIDASLDLEQL